MQQFARILVEGSSIPVIISEGKHLDLRPIVADITPEAIASGALTAVNTNGLVPITGDFTYLAPIAGSARSQRRASTTRSTSRNSK